MSKAVALIPARFNSSRFPGKLMQLIDDKSVIYHTYNSALATNLFADVAVITDSPIIYDEVLQFGGKAIMSRHPHQCGTDRIAEVLDDFPDADIIVNVQGDEPFNQKDPLGKLLEVFEKKHVRAASLMQKIEDEESIANPNHVKVVFNSNKDALLFSRAAIPYHRQVSVKVDYYKHIGVYAFRRDCLLQFVQLPALMLEQAEQLEGLRFVEHGIPLKMVECVYQNIGIDTPQDLLKARELLKY